MGTSKILTQEDITDKSFNPEFIMTEEVQGIMRNIFNELNPNQDGKISSEALLALVLASGMEKVGSAEEDRLIKAAQDLLAGHEQLTFEDFCVVAMQWKEMSPESV
jgi:Ca2+-binding EF-hand superfamily protein